MLIDAALSFGQNFTLVGGAGVAIPSPLVVDLAGVGQGVAPPSIWGNTAVFAAPDAMGNSQMRPELVVGVGTTFTTANGATLNVALQGAIDTGVGGGYLPGAWNTFGESGPLAVANLVANTIIFRSPWLPPWPFNLRPRFLRLLFTPPAATNFSAGTIAYATSTIIPDAQSNKFASKNYTVA